MPHMGTERRPLARDGARRRREVYTRTRRTPRSYPAAKSAKGRDCSQHFERKAGLSVAQRPGTRQQRASAVTVTVDVPE